MNTEAIQRQLAAQERARARIRAARGEISEGEIRRELGERTRAEQQITPEQRQEQRRVENLRKAYTGNGPFRVYGREHSMAADQAYNEDAMKEFLDWELKAQNEFTKIYKHKTEDRHLVGVRGTYSLSDAAIDVSLPFRDVKKTDRYKSSEKLLQDYLASLGEDTGEPRRLEVAGHSLGGHLADELGKQFNAQRIVQFNSYRSGKEGGQTEHYTTTDDPLQYANKLLRRDRDATSFDFGGGHSISNFSGQGLGSGSY